MELSAVDTVAELGYSARHSLRVGCKARHRMRALLLCWASVSFVPQRCVAHRVQWHVAHPVLLAVSRHAEAKHSDIGVSVLEGPEAFRAEVLLGLDLDGNEPVLVLDQKVDLAR